MPRSSSSSSSAVSSRKRTASIVAGLTVPYWLDSPAPTYPPLDGEERADVAVIGGGVTGLSCARVLAEDGLRVRLVEARRVGAGASGRNGGFALRGLALPYTARREPELWRLSEEAVDRMAELAGDVFRRVGSLHVVADEAELELGRHERDALAADGFRVEWVERDDLPPILRKHYLGGLFNARDGVIEPGRWARRVAALAAEAGAFLAEETPAIALEGTRVLTPRGAIAADRVVVATDGYTHGLLPELDDVIVPARNQVLATVPLRDRLFEPALHARYGYDYWQQTRDGRIVIGGRRDLALEAEQTRSEDVTPAIQSALEGLLETLLGRMPEITHRWAGLLGFTPDHLPLVGPHPARDGVWLSLGYSGHGNALALACGEGVAHALLGKPDARLERLSPGRILGAPAPA